MMRFARACAGVLALALPVAGARGAADEFVDKLNKGFAEFRADARSEPVLLPLLAKLQPPPPSVQTVEAAVMIAPDAPGWTDAESWSRGAPQVEALEAVSRLYRVTDPKKLPVFAQPYGSAGVSAELLKAGMYTDLGEGGMLGGARFLYLQGLSRLEILVHVEAMRRTEAGEVMSAMNLLADFGLLARTIADRQFYKEVRWAMNAMALAVERIRDVAYLDFRGKKALSSEALTGMPAFIERLQPGRGVLEPDRLRLPGGERIAAEQAIAKVYTPRGGVNGSFAQVMSGFGASERPLRLFAESARWQAVAASQKPWFDINDELPKVYDDWTARWMLDPFDRRLQNSSYSTEIDRSSLAVLDATLPPMDELFVMRRLVRVEVVGSRTALGVLGFLYANKLPPQSIQSVRPKWVKQLDADPFNPNQSRNSVPPMEFFVPMRDQARGEREDPTPHEMSVTGPGGESFTLSIRDDQFIVYSVGADGERNMASRVENTAQAGSGTDYLIWPPLRGLVREQQSGGGK